MTADQLPDRLSELSGRVAGTVHLPGTDRYTELATPWNLAVANDPIAVVEVANADDVARTVRFAREAGVRVKVQSTGHGAVQFAGPVLQISTKSLTELAIDAAGTARCGAGLSWAQVIPEAARAGFAAIGGSAPGVGIAGFLTGAGIGPLARSLGLSSDYVTAFDVVTADGEVRRAAPTENPDLFWGLRGGRGLLGTVTAVEIDLIPLTEFLGGCLYFDGADAAAVLHTWQQWTPTLPDEATSSIAIVRLPERPGVPEPLAGRTTVAVRFAWTGEVEQGRAVFEQISGAGRHVLGGVDVMPYPQVGTIHSDPPDPMPATNTSSVLHSLTGETVDAILRLAGPDADCRQAIVELRHLGGTMSRERTGPCAYSHRDAAYSLFVVGAAAPPVAEAVRRNAGEIVGAVAEWSTGKSLPNFGEVVDVAAVAAKYDSATLARLAELSTTYDPDGVMVDAANLRTAAGARAAT